MRVNVELGINETLRMIKNGASYVTQWSIDNNVICYNRLSGFTTGRLIFNH